MAVLSWLFKTKKEDIPEAESLDLTPVLDIPEKTRRELYDSAVEEVMSKRVYGLVLREFTEIINSSEEARQTIEAIEYADGVRMFNAGDSTLADIRNRFPKACLKTSEGTSCGYELTPPALSISNLAKGITDEFMRSDSLDFKK